MSKVRHVRHVGEPEVGQEREVVCEAQGSNSQHYPKKS